MEAQGPFSLGAMAGSCNWWVIVWELFFRGLKGKEVSFTFLLRDVRAMHSSVTHWLSIADQKVWLAVSFVSTNLKKEDKVIII